LSKRRGRASHNTAVIGHEPVAMCGAEFAVHLREKFEEYGRVIREASVKAE
jgi:hypothetical protein